MAADLKPVLVFDARRELARERARKILSGEYKPWDLPIDPAMGLDLSAYRCALCHGNFAEVGFAWAWYESDVQIYAHRFCGREAANWAYDPRDDDYPRDVA